MCKFAVIDLYFCLCVYDLLLIFSLAYVQFVFYQQSGLLMCSRVFIDYTYCLCAVQPLLRYIFAYVQEWLY